ncbi:MAG TPA: hypothetical protein VE442_23980 [Jatrophihabitans sp.]|nr:hypothetical protein [Jatrophihabitans sp.]
MRLPAAELRALVRAHAYLQTQTPPELWHLETHSLEVFVRALGEMIAAALVRNGNDLGALTLGIANVHVVPEAADPLPIGDLVAVSIAGGGEWTDSRWAPGDTRFVSPDLPASLDAAGAVHAYSRRLGVDSGSVTALYSRVPE